LRGEETKKKKKINRSRGGDFLKGLVTLQDMWEKKTRFYGTPSKRGGTKRRLVSEGKQKKIFDQTSRIEHWSTVLGKKRLKHFGGGLEAGI